MKYLRIVSAFTGAVWAMQQEKYMQIRNFLVFKSSGGQLSEEEIKTRIGVKTQREASTGPAVAVIPVYGIISQRLSMMDEISGPGSASTERIANDLRAALADPAVSAIILDIDSPGGTVFGIPELAGEMYKARGKKPIVAIANSLAASGAYWIASAADEIYITPGGEAGSIGVFAEHDDLSKWLENEGIRPTLISAGEFKTEANPYAPLGDEAAAYIQSRVNDYYEMFLKDVAHNRGVSKNKVEKNFGQGRVFGAEQAVASGMVDKIATFDQVLRRLAGSSGGSKVLGSNQAIAIENMSGKEALDKLVESGTVIPEGFAVLEPADLERGIFVAPGAEFCGPIAPHKTGTSEGPWDGPANEARLPSPMSVETARNSYAWMEDDAIEKGEVRKTDCRFIHHEISEAGRPGAANMTACSTGIGVLNGGRGGTTIPDSDRQGVYNHLAKHLRDGDKEPPPLAEAENHSAEMELAKIRNEFEL